MRRGIEGFSYFGDLESSRPLLAFRNRDVLHIYNVRLLSAMPVGDNVTFAYEILGDETIPYDGDLNEELQLRAQASKTGVCYMEDSGARKRPEDKIPVALLGYFFCRLHKRVKRSN